MMDLRIKGMPVTFLVVLLLTLMLTIFFGAWAASADSQAENRNFAFAIGASGPVPGAAEGGSLNGAAEEAAEETWWGSAFLKACPLH
jgi:hypothetical protein